MEIHTWTHVKVLSEPRIRKAGDTQVASFFGSTRPNYFKKGSGAYPSYLFEVWGDRSPIDKVKKGEYLSIYSDSEIKQDSYVNKDGEDVTNLTVRVSSWQWNSTGAPPAEEEEDTLPF